MVPSALFAVPTGPVVPLFVDAPAEAELVRLAVRGDGAAQYRLYCRHFEGVSARVTRLMGNAADVEDVLQDAFLEAFRDLHTLQEPERFRTWLMSIAVHQVHRRFRHRRLLRRLGISTAPEPGLTSLASETLSPDQLLLLRRIDEWLQRQPSGLRLAWLLRYVEGYELSEVAEQCRCSLATAKRWLHKGQLELRKHLGVSPFAESDDE